MPSQSCWTAAARDEQVTSFHETKSVALEYKVQCKQDIQRVLLSC